jgi:Flp pilus assembly protein TadB
MVRSAKVLVVALLVSSWPWSRRRRTSRRRSRRPSHPSIDSAVARPQRSTASRRRQQHPRVLQHARRQQHPCVRWLARRRQHRQHAPLRLPRPRLSGYTVLFFAPSNFVKLRHLGRNDRLAEAAPGGRPWRAVAGSCPNNQTFVL